jgi:hypothetical protein
MTWKAWYSSSMLSATYPRELIESGHAGVEGPERKNAQKARYQTVVQAFSRCLAVRSARCPPSPTEAPSMAAKLTGWCWATSLAADHRSGMRLARRHESSHDANLQSDEPDRDNILKRVQAPTAPSRTTR